MTDRKIIALVDEVFRRISSGGTESVEDLFVIDGIYEGAYAEDYILGSRAIGIMLAKVIPSVISPFAQWPIGIQADAAGELVAVEYMSDGIGVHDGSRYRNLYAGIMRLSGGKIAHWREYYHPGRFEAAVGPHFAGVVEGLMPAGSMKTKTGHTAIGGHHCGQ